MYQTTMSSRMCRVCASLLITLWVLIALTKDIEAQDLNPPAPDFNRHRLVQPTIHHARTKREISTTRDTDGAHHSSITVTVTVDGEDYVLDLQLNQDLVAGDHTISHQRDGQTVLHKPKKEEIDLCHYSGAVRDKPGSWVAVSTCHGLSGVFYDGQKMRYIEPAGGNDIKSQHYIYDHSDLNTEYSCGNDGVTDSTKDDPDLLERYNSQQRARRSRGNKYKRSLDTEVRGPYKSNKRSRYVELVLVADKWKYSAYWQNMQTLQTKLIQLANTVNSIYAPLNIFIALVGVVVWNERDEIQIEEDSDITLTNFLKYRERLVTEIPNDNAQLLTGYQFESDIIFETRVGGAASHNGICTNGSSGSVVSWTSDVIGLVGTMMAHEMGHNFGMHHDTWKCKCPAAECIMSSLGTWRSMCSHWSSCSLATLEGNYLWRWDMYDCLRNKPKRLFDSPTCGNSFTEIGEQCDCGMVQKGFYEDKWDACHACCHADTCMLRSNATCGSGECCDLTTCRPKPAGTVCRPAEVECDQSEYCTGHSEYCPDDVYKIEDDLECGNKDWNNYRRNLFNLFSNPRISVTQKSPNYWKIPPGKI